MVIVGRFEMEQQFPLKTKNSNFLLIPKSILYEKNIIRLFLN